MSRKELATGFLNMVMAKRIREAYEKFIAPNFIHHNQYFKGDRHSLMTAMEEAHAKMPQTKYELKHIYEDGYTVITHGLVRHKPDDAGVAVIHIFRFENDKVAELWDLGQPLQKDGPNENGAF